MTDFTYGKPMSNCHLYNQTNIYYDTMFRTLYIKITDNETNAATAYL